MPKKLLERSNIICSSRSVRTLGIVREHRRSTILCMSCFCSIFFKLCLGRDSVPQLDTDIGVLLSHSLYSTPISLRPDTDPYPFQCSRLSYIYLNITIHNTCAPVRSHSTPPCVQFFPVDSSRHQHCEGARDIQHLPVREAVVLLLQPGHALCSVMHQKRQSLLRASYHSRTTRVENLHAFMAKENDSCTNLRNME
jgi:hypothetical protein